MIDNDPYSRTILKESIYVEYADGLDEACHEMVGVALGLLDDKLGDSMKQQLTTVTVKIGPDIVDGGGEARAEEDLVLLNSSKVVLSLQQSEDLLVEAGYFEPTERTRTLPDIKGQPWSTLVYELVHEFGHVVDYHMPGEPYNRIRPELSPTKYGKKSAHEAFAEMFTYWVFGQEVSSEAEGVLRLAA